MAEKAELAKQNSNSADAVEGVKTPAESSTTLSQDVWSMMDYVKNKARSVVDAVSNVFSSSPKPPVPDLEIDSVPKPEKDHAAPKKKGKSESEDDDDDDDNDKDEHEDKDHKEEDDEPGESTHDPKDPSGETNPLPNNKLYFGSLHGHSVYSDGMCKPKELFQSAKDQNQDFVTITDHSHKTARGGVKPGNPRHEPESDAPLLFNAPQAYTETMHVAKQISEDGKFVGLTGVELGTIGKTGTPGLAGVNHINVIEVPALITTVKSRGGKKVEVELGPELSKFKAPEVIQIKDGDYKALVNKLDQMTDTTGGRPIIQLNHPRWSEDEKASTPEKLRGRDYGQKAFKDQDEWRERFGKYASQLEILSGEATKEVPTGEFKSHAIHAKDFAGYLDKGLHISPTFGRDSHYCDPVGVPAATGVFAENLDKKSILDALRERRTIATMNREALAGFMVMNDKHVMGAVVDEKDASDVHLTVTVSSDIQADAKYTAILWADQNIGDGTLAEKMQTINITGEDLAARKNHIKFHGIEHTAGNKGAYYVEVQRKDAGATKAIRMWTAPVWIEPNAATSR